MRVHRIRRGATSTSTIVIIVAVVVLAVLLIIGCFGAVAAGLMLPALTQARDSAREAARGLMSGAQLRQIDLAYQIWLRDAEEGAALDFDVLIAGNYATRELFVSPFGPARDGGEDYWLLHPRPDADASDPDAAETADLIVGYDRAMYAAVPRVAVVFADGEVEVLDVAEFERLLRSPPNDGVDFNLPPRPSAR